MMKQIGNGPMVESVDTRDLKSLAHCGRAGATPVGATNIWEFKQIIFIIFIFFLH